MDLELTYLATGTKTTGRQKKIASSSSQLASQRQLPCSYIPDSGKVHVTYSYRKLESQLNSQLYMLVLSLASEILATVLPLIPCSLPCVKLMQISLLLLKALGRLPRQGSQIKVRKDAFIVMKSCLLVLNSQRLQKFRL